MLPKLPQELPLGCEHLNTIVIAVSNINSISVFTCEGQFVTSFSTDCGLAVDYSGVVYVCDLYSNCVRMY